MDWHRLRKFVKEIKDVQNAVSLRKESLAKHAEALILARSDFFVEGLEASDVSLKDIAGITGRHVSTVSRALKDRHFAFEGKIYPFSVLWNKKTGGSDKFTIKKIIKSLIDNEEQVLSDTVITSILSKKGIDISRRTVAKYRSELQIGSSYMRQA